MLCKHRKTRARVGNAAVGLLQSVGNRVPQAFGFGENLRLGHGAITCPEFEMEELYHVTKDDSVVGRVQRDWAHDKNILHRSGIVFVVRSDGKILIQNRSPSKHIFPSCYDCSCAFHVTFGESYDDAANRELHEETGISGVLEYLGKFSHYDPPENQIVAVFKCQSDEHIQIDQTEAAGANFYSRSEVEEIVALGRVTPWLRDGWRLVRDKIV